jgi:hypothetical protein
MQSVFNRMEYPAIGQSYESPSLPASAQRTVNMYPEAIPDGLKQIVLHQFPGLSKQLSGITSEFDRGCHVFLGELYQVAGGTLYKVTDGFSRVAIGGIAGGDRVSIADNGTIMVIVTNGNGEYTYDGATLSSVTLGQNPSNVEYLNSRFLYDDDDGRVAVSSVALTTIPAGNYFSPESAPDPLVRSFVFNQFVYLFGENSIEPWQNVTSGTPPFQRMNGAIVENLGLIGKDAIASTEKAIYFVSDDGDAQQLQGFQPTQISTVAVNNEWRQYTLTDAIVQTVRILSLDFVIFSFPTSGKTWGYVEQYGLWFELETGVAGGRWLGNTLIEAYGKRLVADYATGNIYELNPDTYTDNALTTVRERIFRPLAGEQLGKPRQWYQMTELGLAVETGVGGLEEREPLIAISFSVDGGRTWSNDRFKQLGQAGEYLPDVSINTNQHFKDLTVRLRYTEPNKFSLYSAYIDIRESGAR